MKKSYIKVAVVGATASILGASSNAMAVLDTAQADAVTALSTNVTDIIAAAWPVVVLFTAGVVGIKLFKKFIRGAATS